MVKIFEKPWCRKFYNNFFSEVSRCLVNTMSDFKAMQNGSIGHSCDVKTQTPRLQCCVSLY